MSQMPPGTPINYSSPPQKPSAGLAVAAMIVGIVSIFPGCCLSYYGMIVIGIVAIVLGVMARSAAASGRGSGMGMALTGLITGGIGFAIGLVFLLLVLIGGPAMQSKVNSWIKQAQLQQQQQQQQQQQNNATSQP